MVTKNFHQNKYIQSHGPWICAKPYQALNTLLSHPFLRQLTESSGKPRNLINLFWKETKHSLCVFFALLGDSQLLSDYLHDNLCMTISCYAGDTAICFPLFFLNNKWFLTNQSKSPELTRGGLRANDKCELHRVMPWGFAMDRSMLAGPLTSA